MQQLYRPSFQAAIDAGVMSAMESYQEVGGIPMASSSEYLKTLLRSPVYMNFTGMMVTDYREINNLNDWHMVAETQKAAVKMAMKDTTIDMSMVPTGS
jgi:beta-glucosidase